MVQGAAHRAGQHSHTPSEPHGGGRSISPTLAHCTPQVRVEEKTRRVLFDAYTKVHTIIVEEAEKGDRLAVQDDERGAFQTIQKRSIRCAGIRNTLPGAGHGL